MPKKNNREKAKEKFRAVYSFLVQAITQKGTDTAIRAARDIAEKEGTAINDSLKKMLAEEILSNSINARINSNPIKEHLVMAVERILDKRPSTGITYFAINEERKIILTNHGVAAARRFAAEKMFGEPVQLQLNAIGRIRKETGTWPESKLKAELLGEIACRIELAKGSPGYSELREPAFRRRSRKPSGITAKPKPANHPIKRRL